MTATIHRRAPMALVVSVATTLVLASCGSIIRDEEDNSNAAGAVNLEDCEDPDAVTEEITGSITIGISAPLSGPLAGPVEFNRVGYLARIRAANEAGTLDGIRIEVEYRDDALQPDKAKANVTEFIQKDEVDLLSAFGTGPVGAMVDDQNAACVPMLYPTSNEPQFNDVAAYPWTVQFLPPAGTETNFMVQFIQEEVSDPRVGVVENVTATGKVFADAFEENAEEADLEVIESAVDTDPNAAATTMKASGANVIFHAGTAGACGAFDTARGRVGYVPELVIKSSNCLAASEFISAGEAADGNVIATYLKDSSDPTLGDDPGVKEYLEQVGDAEEPTNATTTLGWLQGDLLVNTLKEASESEGGLTRQSIIESARNQDYSSPILIDGISWVATPDRPAGVDGFQPFAWSTADQGFVPAGEVVPVE